MQIEGGRPEHLICLRIWQHLEAGPGTAPMQPRDKVPRFRLVDHCCASERMSSRLPSRGANHSSALEPSGRVQERRTSQLRSTTMSSSRSWAAVNRTCKELYTAHRFSFFRGKPMPNMASKAHRPAPLPNRPIVDKAQCAACKRIWHSRRSWCKP